MGKKVLIAAGCSYTDSKFYSQDETLSEEKRGGWPMWPELLADHLSLKCINTGKCGASNDFIINSVINEIAKNADNVDTVAVLLTGSERYELFNYHLNPPVELNVRLKENHPFPAFSYLEDIGIGYINANYWSSEYFDPLTYKTIINNWVNKILILIKLCKAYNIKLILMQGLEPFDYMMYYMLAKENKIKFGTNKEIILKYFISNPVIAELQKEKDKIIGWPIFNNLGGFSYDFHRFKNGWKNSISKLDSHPNSEGQIEISSFFIKKYTDLYQR